MKKTTILLTEKNSKRFSEASLKASMYMLGERLKHYPTVDGRMDKTFEPLWQHELFEKVCEFFYDDNFKPELPKE